MGFSPFPKDQIVKTLDTGEVAHLGGYTLGEDTELQWIRLRIYKHGIAAGAEQIRVGVFSRPDLLGNLFYSDWVDVADFDVGDYHIGSVRFDFARQFLDADIEYHLGVETNFYTRNGGTFYLSVVADYPIAGNDPATNNAYLAGAADIFGYKERI